MELLSSDTNIWIDFVLTGSLEEPFLLREKYTYLMSADALRDEVLSPPELSDRLLELGVKAVEIDEAEYRFANDYVQKYKRLSVYDSIAMSIAKSRRIILLSGDGVLRNAGKSEGLEVHGTLWVLDELLCSGNISTERYREILMSMKFYAGGRIRLPVGEIDKRLSCCQRA